MTKRFFPCHSDDLIAAALRRARARRLVIRVASRQRAALWLRLAQARMRQTRATPPTHLLIGPLPALRDTIRRAALRAELTPTSRRVLSATDRLLEACGVPRRVLPVGDPPSTTA
jgi:hypothetical protein